MLAAVIAGAACGQSLSEPRDPVVPALTALEQLGKSVFFDQRLSLRGNQSCAACHAPQAGWTGDRPLVNAGPAVYEGSISGLFSNRKPPTVAYAMAPVFHARTEDGETLFVGGNFWDGRATGERLGDPIAEQAQGPFVNSVEQALPDTGCVVRRVCAADYPITLESQFPGSCGVAWPPDVDAACAVPTGTLQMEPQERVKSDRAYDHIATVFLPAPYWWDTEDRPWACVRDGAPRVLETTEVCTDCPHWEPRTRGPSTAPVSMLQAFREALEDTYRARATCRKVIEAFGPVQPFMKTVQAEERHARALSSLFDRMAVQPPRDTWPARVSAPDTLVEACAAAGRAEMERQAIYERLIPFVRDPAARRIMRRIQSQSQRRHLPAFRRCFTRALRPTGRPRGVRRGRSAP